MGDLLGGGSAPSYQQVSPESTMTESQKAMQELLTNLGKMGYTQGMKYFDPTLSKTNQAFYQAATGAIQNGTSRNPKDINAAVSTTMANQPAATATTGVTSNTNTFTPDEKMDLYAQLYDKNTATWGNRWKTLTPDKTLNGVPIAAIEEYKRRKEQAAGADALSKYQGVN